MKRVRVIEPRVRGRVLVEGVDLGNGKPVRAWVTMDRGGITVRRWKGRRAYWMPIKEAAGMLARRSQARTATRMLRG